MTFLRSLQIMHTCCRFGSRSFDLQSSALDPLLSTSLQPLSCSADMGTALSIPLHILDATRTTPCGGRPSLPTGQLRYRDLGPETRKLPQHRSNACQQLSRSRSVVSCFFSRMRSERFSLNSVGLGLEPCSRLVVVAFETVRNRLR